MVETPLLHRDGTGGLFIGTSMFLFALMNSAPAELLHPLTYAALQPSIGHRLANKFTALTNLGLAMLTVRLCTTLLLSGSLRFIHKHPCRYAAAMAKKNAGNNASVGILFLESQLIFQRKRRLT